MALTVGELVGYLRLDDSQWTRTATAAEAKARGLGGAMGGLGAKAGAASKGIKGMSRDLADVGHASGVLPGFINPATGAIAGIGLAAVGSAKAAMSWETAWTGVTKTVDGSPEQMAELEGELRNLAKTLPSTHEEIAGVAEAAGQLGIERDNVSAFTKTMVDLGETTNLSADEAATALARFTNIMGTSQSDVDRLGSSVVELGNNFATTEREIVDMSTRIASAGRQIGLSEGDVLGLSAALSSVGIEAEAGGTAISKVMIDISKAVDTGNESLALFASVAGMSVQDFAEKFRTNAGGAVADFIAGLGRISESGESVTPILEELGFTDVRVGNALRSAAAASELFADAMDTGNTAFEENVALAEEANKRYATMESRLEVAKNKMRDAAISGGTPLAEAFADVATAAATVIDTLANLDFDPKGSAQDNRDAMDEWLQQKIRDSANAPRTSLDSIYGLWNPNRDAILAAMQTELVPDSHLRDLERLSAGMRDVGAAGVEGGAVAADGLGEIEGAAEDAQTEIENLRDAIINLGAVEIGKDAAADALTAAMQNARKPFDDLAEAQQAVAEAQADLNAATTDGERETARAALARAEENLALAEAAITLEGTSAAALENRDAMRDLATQAAETAAEFVDGTVEGAVAADQFMRDAREAFIQTAVDMGMPIDKAEELADQYGLIPTSVETVINTTDNATDRIAAIKAELDRLPREQWVTISVVTNYTETGLQNKLTSGMMPSLEGRAVGGPVTAGRPYLVGEEGPELFVPGASGQIVPNGDLQARTANSYTFNVYGVTMEQAMADAERRKRLVNLGVR